MRLFVAIDVSTETRAHLRRVRDALATRLNAGRGAPRVTWVAESAAHVTLRFIGEISEDTTDKIRAALAAPLDHAAFRVDFHGVGAFPNTRRPRVIWIGARSGQQEAAALAAMVDARLDPIVGSGEARDFRAHLTVARVKEARRFDWDAALASIDSGTSASAIDHVTLYQSKTSPKGPTYTALLTTTLR